MNEVLTFAKLRDRNLTRCKRWHGPAGIEHWNLNDWMTAVTGELGEAANILKKLNRVRDGLVGNRESPEELCKAFGKELADVQIYLDLLAARAGVNLAEVVTNKFNEVSVRNGFPERL